MRTEEKRKEHPGWAIQLDDGSWLCYAHGYFTDADAFYADNFDTKSKALSVLHTAVSEGYLPEGTKGKAVEAWQPLCERLRHSVKELESANKVSPDILFDVVFTIENALHQLKVK
jgi:hypothetical protein